MKRRAFLEWTVASGFLLMSKPLYAENKWNKAKVTNIAKVLEKLYPHRTIIPSDKVTIEIPKIVTSPRAVPIHIVSEIEAKKVTLISEKGKENIIGTFNVPKDAIIDYVLKAKFPSGEQVACVILEDIEGNLYSNFTSFQTALSGGCEG